jgi:RNA polymerase sigma factor (sigma-70 family)
VKIINREAIRFSTQLEYEDLFQEGYLIYLKIMKTYNKDSSFMAALTLAIKRKFIDLVRKNNYRGKIHNYISEEELRCEPSFIWELVALDYSKDARLLMNLITKSSEGMLSSPGVLSIRRAFSEIGLDCTIPLKEVYEKLRRDVSTMRHLLTSTNGKCDRCHHSKKGACYGNHKG